MKIRVWHCTSPLYSMCVIKQTGLIMHNVQVNLFWCVRTEPSYESKLAALRPKNLKSRE